MSNTEISHLFSDVELMSGFKVGNFRAIVTRLPDGVPGILLGGSYHKFNRINDTLAVTFSPFEIKRIARELLTLAEDIEQKILIQKINSLIRKG